MLTKFWNCLKQYNASTHALAILAIALPAAFYGYQPFHALVISVYNSLPGWLSVLIGTAVYLWSLYKTGVLTPKSTT
jgi:hypothetical protein